MVCHVTPASFRSFSSSLHPCCDGCATDFLQQVSLSPPGGAPIAALMRGFKDSLWVTGLGAMQLWPSEPTSIGLLTDQSRDLLKKAVEAGRGSALLLVNHAGGHVHGVRRRRRRVGLAEGERKVGVGVLTSCRRVGRRAWPSQSDTSPRSMHAAPLAQKLVSQRGRREQHLKLCEASPKLVGPLTNDPLTLGLILRDRRTPQPPYQSWTPPST